MEDNRYYTPTKQEIIEHIINGEDIYGKVLKENKNGEIVDTSQILKLTTSNSVGDLWKYLKNNGRIEGSSVTDIDENSYKIRYLDKEDIEELGFTYMVDSYSGYFTNGKVRIAWFYDKSGIEITKETNAEFGNKTLFVGTIKNKSELKKLLEQLNIQ